MTIRIIACNVFREALRKLDTAPEDSEIVYLPSFLHLRPLELKESILCHINRARERGEAAGCLFGRCFPGIDDVLNREETLKIPGDNCYQMLLGNRTFDELMDEHPGVFFLEKELIENFEEYCIKPLELDDPVLREMYFRHYQRAVYIRQSPGRELVSRAGKIARMLSLKLLVLDADCSELEENFKRFITSLREK